MTKKQVTTRKPSSRQIIGFSLSPEMAAEVKDEARRRQLQLRELFEEIWSIYKTKH